MSRIDKVMRSALLSLSAGALVYVGATHFLPQAEDEDTKYNLVATGKMSRGGFWVTQQIRR